MGWAAGTRVAEGVIAAIRKTSLTSLEKQTFYQGIINVLEDQDWDCQDECLGLDPDFDVAYYVVHPLKIHRY